MIKVAHLQTSSLKRPVFFIDFNDSFSYNILAYLKKWVSVEIISPQNVENYLTKDDMRFIWGPGPGRADEYGIDFKLLKQSLLNSTQRHFGICLGHQLIGLSLGGKYKSLSQPLHGVSRSVTLPEWSEWGMNGSNINAQFYNSLVVEIGDIENARVHRYDNEVLMISSQTVISCQFHPESVGTSCPERLFSAIMQNFL